MARSPLWGALAQGGLIHNEALKEGAKNKEPTPFHKWAFLGGMGCLELTGGAGVILEVEKHSKQEQMAPE